MLKFCARGLLSNLQRENRVGVSPSALVRTFDLEHDLDIWMLIQMLSS